MFDSFYWINEPQQWQLDNNKLTAVTDDKTDFWRKTWYEFERFSGHIFVTDVVGDFTFQVKVQADFDTLYDQAGIMFMLDEQRWLKAGIEFNDGVPAIGSVLTLENSDWATGTFSGNPRKFWLRLTRKGDALRLQYSSDGQQWPLLRLCYFPLGCAKIGLMCCTPERRGLTVEFLDIKLLPPMEKPLHDLS